MENRNLTFSIPVSLLEETKKQSREKGITVSELIRRLLSDSVGAPESSTATSELLAEFNALDIQPKKSPYKWKREDAYEDQ